MGFPQASMTPKRHGGRSNGQGARFGGFKPVEGEDAAGNALKSQVLEIDRDEDGELVGRISPRKRP